MPGRQQPESRPGAEGLVIILASACGVALLARAGLPAVLGYLLAGWAIGPHGLQFLASSEETRYLGELGIIFLMFMVGLEFSLPTMIAARTDVFGAGSLQVGVTLLIVAAITKIGGTDWSAAIILGGAVAMSSTAVAFKQLADQGELGSQHGRLATGVLLFQDLAALPFLVVAVAWQGSTEPDLLDILHQLTVAGTALVGAAIVRGPYSTRRSPGLRKRSRRISCSSPACFWRWVRHLPRISRDLRRLSAHSGRVGGG